MQGNYRFIRKNGRVIPIQVDSAAGVKGNLKANAPTAKREAIHEANDQFNALSDKHQSMVKSAFGIAQKVAAIGGGAALGKYALDQAHNAAGTYQSKAHAARGKYSALAVAGGGTAVGAGSFLVHQAVKGRLGLKGALIGGAAAAAGTAGAIVGGIGASKAAEHERRANMIRKATTAIKKYTG